MKVYGQLEAAAVEILSADPASTVQGRIWYNSTTGRAMLDDGLTKAALLRNDGKLVIGTNATAANNARIHRAGTAFLQVVLGNDVTAEGTPATALGQLGFRSPNYTTATRPVFGNPGRTVFDTDLTSLMLDTGTAWTQVMAAKDYAAKGDLQAGTGAGAYTPVTVGSNNQVLVADSAQTAGMKWQALVSAKGDLVAGTGAGAYTQVPVGSLNQVLVADPAQTTGMKWATIGSGGTGKNYLGTVNGVNGNGDFELGASTKWDTFVTTLTGKIPTGSITTGSAAASINTFTAVSSGKLAGGYSLSTAASVAWAAGQGFLTDPFTIDIEDQAKVMSFKFAYKLVSGTVDFSGTSSNTFAVYIYDVSGNSWIQPAGVYGMTQSSGVGICQGTFQTTATGTQYRLCVLCINATGSTTSMLWDDFSVGPQSIAQGSPITDWQFYTPTFQGFGTPSFIETYWRRVGGNIEIKGRFTPGGATAVEARVYLPSGLISASNFSAITIAGKYSSTASTPNSPNGAGSILIEPSVNYITFSGENTGGLSLTKQNGNAISSTNPVAYFAAIPVAGWSSQVQMSNDTDTRLVAAKYTSTATTGVANTVTKLTYATRVIDTHAGMSGDTYTVPVSGIYKVSGMIQLGSNSWSTGALELRLYKNGSLDSQIAYFTQATGSLASSTISASGSTLVQANAGDTLTFYGIQSQTASIALSGSTQTNFVTIERLCGPAVVAATETVGLRYTNTAGTSNTTAYTVLPFPTKDYDTHGIYNTGTGVATVPVSGKYFVSAQYAITQGTQPVLYMAIYKNGVLYSEWNSQYSSSTTPITVGMTDTLNLIAGDQISIYMKNSVGAQAIQTTAGRNFLNIVRIGN